MSDWRPGISRAALAARADLMARVRTFFAQREVLEVDTPLLASFTVTDPALEALAVTTGSVLSTSRFLQTSPEFAMKRLLAAGSGPVYQLGKAFRDGEAGRRHNPEFTMLEWYRPGYSLAALIEEVAALVCECLGRQNWYERPYRDLFLEMLDLDPHDATGEELATVASRHMDVTDLTLDRDGWLDLLMSHCVEPRLVDEGLIFVTDYPASQAALAIVEERGGVPVAARFELFVDGMELANGYRELQDSAELERRAARDNRWRRVNGQAPRELDPRLLAAMEAGLPDCSGVALGFDRMLMLLLGADALGDVLPFDWERS